MPAATLTFSLPEEEDEFRVAADGLRWRAVAQALDQHLRERLMYGHDYASADDALQSVRDKLHEEVEDEGLKLY